MITVMRKHHKILMIVITALVCISFSWYWNKTDFGQLNNGAVGRIYDHNVTQVEFQRNARLLRLASQLGMRNLVRELTTGAQNAATWRGRGDCWPGCLGGGIAVRLHRS